jgi:hypothetical protein
MMQIRPDGSFAKPNDLRVTNKSMKLDVNQVTEKRNTEMTEILDEFGSVFEGIGKIRDNKNDSEMNFVSIPHVAFRTTVLNFPFTERKLWRVLSSTLLFSNLSLFPDSFLRLVK